MGLKHPSRLTELLILFSERISQSYFLSVLLRSPINVESFSPRVLNELDCACEFGLITATASRYRALVM